MLGLNRGDYLPLQDIEVDTANGRVYRRMTAVEINFKDDRGAYMGDWKISPCLLNPPYLLNPVTQTRLSGMRVRNNYYTATAPDGTDVCTYQRRKMVLRHGCQRCNSERVKNIDCKSNMYYISLDSISHPLALILAIFELSSLFIQVASFFPARRSSTFVFTTANCCLSLHNLPN